MKQFNIAVIGAGRMGANHIRVLSEMNQVNLVAVCDSRSEEAEKLAKKFFIPKVYQNPEQLLNNTDLQAVVIAAPTIEHAYIATACIEKGLDLLVEKPMASTVEECRKIIELAEAKNVRLMIGHIERFNPVIDQIRTFLKDRILGDIYYIETVRSGPFPKRLYGSKDGVVIDLAVHDLDLIHYLGGKLTQIYAHNIQTDTHNQDIYAKVMFKSESGILGSSEFSWISPKKERSISIYGDNGMLFGNLLDQEVWFFENGDVSVDYSDNYYQNVLWGRVSEGKVIKYPIKKEEPLRNEHEFFCKLVRDRDIEFDPVYGKLAVQYSHAVLTAAEENRIIFFE